jgi:hypothetical protein
VGLSHINICIKENFAPNLGYSFEYRCIHAAPPLSLPMTMRNYHAPHWSLMSTIVGSRVAMIGGKCFVYPPHYHCECEFIKIRILLAVLEYFISHKCFWAFAGEYKSSKNQMGASSTRYTVPAIFQNKHRRCCLGCVAQIS